MKKHKQIKKISRSVLRDPSSGRATACLYDIRHNLSITSLDILTKGLTLSVHARFGIWNDIYKWIKDDKKS